MASSHNGQHRDERRSDLAVLNANEYKQKRRLERILDAMDNIVEKKNTAKEAYYRGDASQTGRDTMVQNAVNDAIYECWNLLVDHQRTREKQANENESVPARSEYFLGIESDPIGVIPQHQGEDILITGLRDYIQLPEHWTESWSSVRKPRNSPPKTETQTIEHTVPERVSWGAAIRLKEFLNDVHDLEIQFKDLDDSKLPMIRDFDQSGDEPSGEVTVAEYNRSPDL